MLPLALIGQQPQDEAYSNYTHIYTYDRSGNLTHIRHSAPATGNNYTTQMMVSNRSNRAVVSTLTKELEQVNALFDAGGNQLQLQPGQHLTWNPRGELAMVTPVTRSDRVDDSESYRYDADSQRVIKQSARVHGGSTHVEKVIYLPGLEIRTVHRNDERKEELHRILTAQGQALHWAIGKPEGIGNDQIRYNQSDIIDSIGLEIDASGQLISHEEYYPYGGHGCVQCKKPDRSRLHNPQIFWQGA